MKTINFQHYGYPYGPVTDYEPSWNACPSEAVGENRLWLCSRTRGHTGRHEAGGLNGRAVYATWEDAPDAGV